MNKILFFIGTMLSILFLAVLTNHILAQNTTSPNSNSTSPSNATIPNLNMTNKSSGPNTTLSDQMPPESLNGSNVGKI
jgi:hypothetical protein